jgi:hypothetical protein
MAKGHFGSPVPASNDATRIDIDRGISRIRGDSRRQGLHSRGIRHGLNFLLCQPGFVSGWTKVTFLLRSPRLAGEDAEDWPLERTALLLLASGE